VKFGLPNHGLYWIDTDVADLGWDTGLLQLGHHSYTPAKECPAGRTCGPNTWHWDNVTMNSAVPFSLIRADRRYVDAENAATPLQLAEPAPSGAYLRFSGVADQVEVSADDGATWILADEQKARTKWGGVRSYRAWLPAGAQALLVRAQRPPDGPSWLLRDFAAFGFGAANPADLR
jgi:hypothetical protein